MRLYLLPISTKKTLIYCQRINQVTASRTTLVDKATARANIIWRKWEKSDSRWQQRIVGYGNKIFERISFAEWGLKSIPPLSTRRRSEEMSTQTKVDVLFPSSAIPRQKIGDLLRRLATERQPLHKKKMWWSIAGLPVALPFGLIPIIPNLPFIYLVFRAWSHWRALSGSKHLEFLLDNKLLTTTSSSTLDLLYDARRASTVKPDNLKDTSAGLSDGYKVNGRHFGDEGDESIILSGPVDKDLLVDKLGVPELSIELERALSQVTKHLEETELAKKKLAEEKEVRSGNDLTKL